MIKIALDSSCLNVKKTHPVLNELNTLEEERKIQFFTSTVNSREQADTNEQVEYREKYLKRIRETNQKPEVGLYGFSFFGTAVYGDASVTKGMENIFGQFEKLSDNNLYDAWLLITAIAHGCDYFLTKNTKHFVDQGRQTKIELLGIKVRLPNEQFLEELRTSESEDIP